MNQFDEKIKCMAKREASIAPIGAEERINRVLAGLNQETIKKLRRASLKGGKLAAAVVAACLLIGGTAYAAANWKSFDWQGNVVNTEPGPAGEGEAAAYAGVTSAPNGAQSADETEFYDLDAISERLAEDEVFRVVQAGNAGLQWVDNSICISDVSSLERLFAETGCALMLPAEIPSGYEFQTSRVSFYLPADYAGLISGPTKTESLGNGAMLEIFKLPDGYRNHIASVAIEYQNQDGESIRYDASLMEGTMDFGGSESAQAETQHKEGYTNLLYLNDTSDEFAYRYRMYARQEIQATRYMTVSELGAEPDADRFGSYDSIVYSVQSTALGKGDLLPMLS